MDIGTAKPTREEMGGIPHHMLDVAEPDEDFSVSRYCAMAAPIVDDILARGKTAIIAGGTGLYMDALIKGNDFAPFPSTGVREELEARADREGMEAMMALLAQVDPVTAQRLPISDRKRILRALEIYLETGETMTEHDRKTQALPPRYTPIWLGLDFSQRQTLYDRINRRVGVMLEMGLLDEIRALLSSGIPAGCTAMQAIGYKEFTAALAGWESIDSAADRVRQASRRYAKRQLTWFRRNKAIHWLIRGDDDPAEEIIGRARQVLREFDTGNLLA